MVEPTLVGNNMNGHPVFNPSPIFTRRYGGPEPRRARRVHRHDGVRLHAAALQVPGRLQASRLVKNESVDSDFSSRLQSWVSRLRNRDLDRLFYLIICLKPAWKRLQTAPFECPSHISPLSCTFVGESSFLNFSFLGCWKIGASVWNESHNIKHRIMGNLWDKMSSTGCKWSSLNTPNIEHSVFGT